MGKRGKGSPNKVEKPGDIDKGKSTEPKTPNSVSNKSDKSDCGSDEKLNSSKVVIDYNCRRLAEEALCKTSGDKIPLTKGSTTCQSASTTESKKVLQKTPVKTRSSPQRKESTVTTRHCRRESPRRKQSTKPSEQQKSQVSKPVQAGSPTARRRRKALTQALRRLRKTQPSPKALRKSKTTRVSPRHSSPIKRSLRTRNSTSDSSEKVKITRSRGQEPKRNLFNMERNIKENEEGESSPSVASNNISPSSPESEDQTDSPTNYEGNDTDSDDDIEMQVLEKQVESDKEEEDDGPPDVSLNLPDDTDEESSLLSPSALPASQLFRSPSSRRKKRKSLSEGASSEKPRKQQLSTPVLTSTPLNPSYSSSAPAVASTSSAQSLHTISPVSSSSVSTVGEQLGPLPGKRGRGRPRKALEDVKSLSGKLYRKKLAERMSHTVEEVRDPYNYDHQEDTHPYASSSNPYDDYDPVAHQMDEFYEDEIGHNETESPADTENFHHRLQRWKDRSTFVYAKHKFVSNENKFRCDTCQVSFTALSSLKRHYGTIYHKQQEAAGRSTLDLSDILRPDRDGNVAGQSSGPSPYFPSGRGRGRGRPPLARTTSFVRRSAVDNIKKYYAAADAARRRRENYTASSTTTTVSRGAAGFTSTWLQKQQRKRKPLLHSDYLYPSASAESEIDDVDDDDDDFGCEDEENNENDSPENGNNNDSAAIGEDVIAQTPWLSNVWKGIGPPHFTCEVCGASYTKKFEFTKHLFQHRQEEAKQLALTCPDCLVVCHNEQMLENHFNLFNHGVGVIRDGRAGREVKKLTCVKCNSKFARRDYYRKHLEVHKRPLLKCPHCPKKFLYKFYLSDHVKAKHDGWSSNVANSTPNNNNNNGVSVGSLPAGNNTTAGNPTALPNPNNNLSNNIPKPKVELYSSTTPLLISTETNKRKNPTNASVSSEASSYDVGIDDAASKKKNLSAPSGQRSTAAATLTSSRDIMVPKFITCDPFGEENEIQIVARREHKEGDTNKVDNERISVTQAQSTVSTLSSVEQAGKERVNLLQKFFESQNDPTSQDQPESDSTNSQAEDGEPISNANLNLPADPPSGLSGIGHSTTEDGKIVFQLEHSMFKGFSTMAGGDGDENACNMSPLTIEIPRDNINMDAEEDVGPTEEPARNSDSKVEDPVDTEKNSIVHTQKPAPSPTGTADNDKIESLHSTNSNSSSLTSSALQPLGCGVKVNLSVKPQPENEMQCQDCGKIFEHKKSLIKHVRYYSQGESYPCTLCDKTFKLKHHVSRHIKSFHNIDTSSTTSSASDDTLSEDHGDLVDTLNSSSAAARGGPTFSGSGLLTIPSSTSTGVEAAAGLKKEFPAATSSSSTKRIVSTDKSTPSTPQKERKRSASDASKKKEDADASSSSSSFSKSNYTTITDDNGVTVFKCLICKKLYPSKHQISSHLSYHKRTIPYKCTVCSAEFKFKHDLNAHQQVHDAEKSKLICEKCPNKSFLSRKDLLKHMREKHHHLGRKPLASDNPNEEPQVSISRCPLCPLVFPQESDLQVHISVDHHKKVACPTCGQVLGSTELLKEHMIEDHNVGIDDDDDAGHQNFSPVRREEVEEGEGQPSTFPPQTSVGQLIEKAQESDDGDYEPEEEGSSPEFELLELN